MKIIDAEPIIKKIDNYSILTENQEYYNGFRDGLFYASDLLLYAEEKDLVHISNGCYCKECQYKWDDNSIKTNTYWCGLNDNTMPLNGFCSEGRKG